MYALAKAMTFVAAWIDGIAVTPLKPNKRREARCGGVGFPTRDVLLKG
jgi:hypothetical protein